MSSIPNLTILLSVLSIFSPLPTMESLKPKDIAGMIEDRDTKGLDERKSEDLLRNLQMQAEVTKTRLKMQKSFEAQQILKDLRREELQRQLQEAIESHERPSAKIVHEITYFHRKMTSHRALAGETESAEPIDTSAPRPPRAVDSTPVAPKAPEPKAA